MALAIPNNDNQLEKYDQKKFNVLHPTSQVARLNPFYTMTVSVVELSTNPDDGDCYAGGKFHKADEVSISKNGILKLARAAGLEWDYAHCRRTDDRQNKDVVEFEVVACMRKPDGTREWFKATKAIDLSEMPPNEAAVQRVHKVALCETKAMLRLVRAALQVKQKYKKADLEKPFVVPCLSFNPDWNDPEVRRLMLLSAAGAQADLMGNRAALPDGDQVMDAEVQVQGMLGPGTQESMPSSAGQHITDVSNDDDEMEEMGADDNTLSVAHSFMVELKGAATRERLAEVSKAANQAKKDGKISDADWEPLLAAYKARKAELGG